MTLRTTSATRRRVVSRSSDVANTSATSRSKDSAGSRSGLETTEPMERMIPAALRLPISSELCKLKVADLRPLAPILWVRCKCLQDCDTFLRNQGRSQRQIHQEF